MFTSRGSEIRRYWQCSSPGRAWCATACCGSILSQADLDLAARYINENFRGWTMESMRAELSRRIEKERSEYDRLMNSIEQLYKQGALAA
jgi:transcriptional regulator of heat shock response